MSGRNIVERLKSLFVQNGRLRTYVVPLAAMLVMSALLAGGAVHLSKYLNSIELNRQEIGSSNEELGIRTEMEVPDGITNIALFGIDARNEEFRGLSDSIMVISLDADHHCIKIISVMRDSLVNIEGYGQQKINAAYSLGGAQLAVKTLNQNFDLNIRDYATVDFVSMADIIEAVGGLELELTEREVRNANIHIESMHRERGTALDYIQNPGKQMLNGVQAVAFARIRKVPTINGTVDDGGRTERQRLVMQLLFDKARTMDVSKYPKMIKALMPCMETSLTYAEIFKLAGLLTQKNLEFLEARMPANEMLINYGLYVKGLGSCKYYNLEYAAKAMNAFVFENIPFDQYMEENPVDYTRWFFGETYDPNAPEEGDEPEEEEPEEEPIEPETPEEQPTIGSEEEPEVTPEQPEISEPEVEEPEEEPIEPETPEEEPETEPEEEPPQSDPPATPVEPIEPVTPAV